MKPIRLSILLACRRRVLMMAASTACALAGCVGVPPVPVKQGGDQHWVGTWSASPMAADAVPFESNSGFANQTVRHITHVSLAGRQVRVRLSNAFGTTPLTIGAVHIARAGAAASIDPGSDRALTFHGNRSITIPAGALALSDPVDFAVAVFADLAVSVYFPDITGPMTWHQLGVQTAYISTPGDFTAAAAIPVSATATSRYVLADVEVAAANTVGAVVTLGDSITDGYGSTVDANHRWPDFLSQRLNGEGRSGMAVLNQGISGNRLLHDVFGANSLARFDRDVLAQAGVTHLIVLEGINDIGIPGALGLPGDQQVDADRIILGLQQLIERAHEKKLVIIGGTLTPFEGTAFPGYYTPAGELKRQAVNAWIRTTAEFDGVIDFDLAVRDPSHPTRLLAAYDCGDHLHPNDAGYRAMADSIDLKLFQSR